MVTKLVSRGLEDELKINNLGTVKTFTEVYREYYSDINKYILRLTNWDNEAVAEDLTQEVFVKVLTKAEEKFTPGTNFKGWVYKIARNAVIVYMRKKSNLGYNNISFDTIYTANGSNYNFSGLIQDNYNFVQDLENLGYSSRDNQNPEELVGEKMEAERLNSRIYSIFKDRTYKSCSWEDYVEPLELELQGYTCQEIAELMNISRNAVLLRLHRGRKIIKDSGIDLTRLS
ncbi:MAG TPA: sigma-70 family RNA polymerase sigma factor [Candidatus Nanoarchaeia archaeon]|nr:sigma-70 family RNA polymerase sigma factor [Candidatus Nanoarchaeia archaeon]